MTYPELTWHILCAESQGILDPQDAKYALEAIRQREHPRAIEKFINVSIRIMDQERRKQWRYTTTTAPSPRTTT